ncbi:MAG TPA: S41 family peptidase [Candidatus Methylacidiphilales bacterium]|nr:S41 family peptidase [Candidatus Methylacidiphilales bacterium]
MARARLTALLTAFFLLTGILGWQSGRSAAPAEKPDESYQYTLLFARVLQLIRQDYVDPDKVGYKDLTYAALRGMLASLDPHSQFLDEESFQDIQRETKGEFSGLGIVVGVKDGGIIILSPMEDTPGERAGLMPGDRILKIDGKNTEKMTLAAAEKALKGEPGEKARLTLLRPVAGAPGGGTVFEVVLTRETIRVSSVKDARLLPASMAGQEKIGYVRIEEFGENTPDELDHALESLEQAGIEGLVIDLRNNPGGLLDSAVDVAGKFLPPNTVIVSTRGRTAEESEDFRARPQPVHPDYPIALLINGYSASGAEIVAGALKDLNRAILVGETTFGKGSVQTVQPLGNGVGLRLTMAKYYTPSKKTIQAVGVSPDIEVPISDTEERRIILAEASRSLTPEEKTEAAKAEDRQLERAAGALRSILIYKQRQALDASAKTPAPQSSDPATTPAR